MYRFLIAKTLNGREVYVNFIKSAAGKYLNQQPYLVKLIQGLLELKELEKLEELIEHDMGRVIGNTEIVKTNEKDVIFYAQRNKTSVYSRYVKNRPPAPSSVLTVVLIQDEDGNYEISDTWIGNFCPPFPGDEKATKKSKSFWDEHALIMDLQGVQSKSITKVCPY